MSDLPTRELWHPVTGPFRLANPTEAVTRVWLAFLSGDLKSRDEMNEEAALVQFDDDGWTCEGHEPSIGCETCLRIQPATVRRVLDAAWGVSDE